MTEQNQGQTFGPESDPKDFTGDQVAAYLKDADQAEVDRVLAAETGPEGKDRVGVKDAAEARTTALSTPAPQEGDGADEKPPVTTEAKTFSEAAEDAVESRHKAYAQGYFGTVPSRDGENPVDLTLAGVTAKSDKDA